MSAPSMRYLDQVKNEMNNYLQEHVPYNHFTGERGVGLNSTLEEVETLFNANDNVRNLSESGELASLHNRVNDLRDSSTSTYYSIRNRLEKVIETCDLQANEVMQ
jgi:hypothetical protein